MTTSHAGTPTNITETYHAHLSQVFCTLILILYTYYRWIFWRIELGGGPLPHRFNSPCLYLPPIRNTDQYRGDIRTPFTGTSYAYLAILHLLSLRFMSRVIACLWLYAGDTCRACPGIWCAVITAEVNSWLVVNTWPVAILTCIVTRMQRQHIEPAVTPQLLDILIWFHIKTKFFFFYKMSLYF